MPIRFQKTIQRDKTQNPLEEEYNKIRHSAIPDGRNLRYTETLYAQVKAIQRIFGSSEQKIIEEAVGFLYKTLLGVSPNEIVKNIRRRFDQEQKFQRLTKIVSELRKIDKEEYPELKKIGDFAWKTRLDFLQMEKHALEWSPERMGDFYRFGWINNGKTTYIPPNSVEGHLALIKEQIRLVAEVIDILQDYGT